MDTATSGVVITVEPDEFQRLLKSAENPMVVHQLPKWYQPYHRYLLSYRSMTFYTRSKTDLAISRYCDVVQAKGFCAYGTV